MGFSLDATHTALLIFVKMRFHELVTLAQELNADFLRPVSPDGANGPKTGKASVEVSEPDIRQRPKASCFCGVLRESAVTAADYADHIILMNGGKTGAVAVGFVIDEATARKEGDLDVVLAVGINYGQGHRYLGSGVGVTDNTGMRPKLRAAFNAIAGNGKCDLGWSPAGTDEPSYHLAAVNIFPWITRCSWSAHGFNASEEALFIECFNPIQVANHIAAFIEQTAGRGFHALVFHGARNAVPYFGTEFTKSNSGLLRGHAEAVFCDNLSPSYRAGVTNAVRLCRRHASKGSIMEAL